MKFEFHFNRAHKSASVHNSVFEELTIFVDYGDDNSGNCFDHHASDEKTCSTSIVCSSDGIARLAKLFEHNTDETLHIVTHADPDLDSVAAAVVVKRFLGTSPEPLDPSLVEYILREDQGEQATEDFNHSLSLLFQAVSVYANNDDERMQKGILLIELVDKAIKGRSFHLGWNALSDIPEIAAKLSNEFSLLNSDLEATIELLANAPKTLLSVPKEDKSGRPEYGWAECLLLDFSGMKREPIGWKSLARGETRFTMFGDPNPFMVVRSTKHGRDNYIISVSAESGFSLKGFGGMLDFIETKRSKQLDQDPAAWDQCLKAIAANRSPTAKASLDRCIGKPRKGYLNADPWYDGRGHDFTIIDTPDSGSVLAPGEILQTVMDRYNPLWKEYVNPEKVVCREVIIDGENTKEGVDWIHPFSSSFEAMGICCQDGVDSYCLADLVASLANEEISQKPIALYIPIVPASSQTIPDSDSDLHILLALYQLSHRLMPLSSSLPRLDSLRKWSTQFVSSPFPGCWWTVSLDSGLVALDYMPNDLSRNWFAELSEHFLALAKQMAWTEDLSLSMRQKKRHEALGEFISRNKI